MSLERRIQEHMAAHASELGGEAQVALFRLMRCHAHRHQRHPRELDEALDAFLDAAGEPSLKAAPCRRYVERFLHEHPKTAAFQFFKDGRKTLSDSDYAAVRYWFVDTLVIESWPAAD